MKVTALVAFALGASALPSGWWGWNGGSCLTDAAVQKLIAGSITFLQHTDMAAATAVATTIFAPNIVEYGDSINALRGAPLGTIVENGRDGYIKDTESVPGVPQINTLDIVHDCNQVAWHWEFIGIGAMRIHGFTLMKVDGNGQIYRQDVEFNSLTWATDVGFTVTPPTSGPYSGNGGS